MSCKKTRLWISTLCCLPLILGSASAADKPFQIKHELWPELKNDLAQRDFSTPLFTLEETFDSSLMYAQHLTNFYPGSFIYLTKSEKQKMSQIALVFEKNNSNAIVPVNVDIEYTLKYSTESNIIQGIHLLMDSDFVQNNLEESKKILCAIACNIRVIENNRRELLNYILSNIDNKYYISFKNDNRRYLLKSWCIQKLIRGKIFNGIAEDPVDRKILIICAERLLDINYLKLVFPQIENTSEHLNIAKTEEGRLALYVYAKILNNPNLVLRVFDAMFKSFNENYDDAVKDGNFVNLIYYILENKLVENKKCLEILYKLIPNLDSEEGIKEAAKTVNGRKALIIYIRCTFDNNDKKIQLALDEFSKNLGMRQLQELSGRQALVFRIYKSENDDEKMNIIKKLFPNITDNVSNYLKIVNMPLGVDVLFQFAQIPQNDPYKRLYALWALKINSGGIEDPCINYLAMQISRIPNLDAKCINVLGLLGIPIPENDFNISAAGSARLPY